MNGVEHPESEQLIAYSEQPESVEHQAVGLHLASCGQCRMDLETSTNLRRHAGWISTNLTELSDEIEGEMSDLLNNRLSGQAAAELRERIKQNPAMLREALHYARHHVAMELGREFHRAVWITEDDGRSKNSSVQAACGEVFFSPKLGLLIGRAWHLDAVGTEQKKAVDVIALCGSDNPHNTLVLGVFIGDLLLRKFAQQAYTVNNGVAAG